MSSHCNNHVFVEHNAEWENLTTEEIGECDKANIKNYKKRLKKVENNDLQDVIGRGNYKILTPTRLI